MTPTVKDLNVDFKLPVGIDVSRDTSLITTGNIDWIAPVTRFNSYSKAHLAVLANRLMGAHGFRDMWISRIWSYLDITSSMIFETRRNDDKTSNKFMITLDDNGAAMLYYCKHYNLNNIIGQFSHDQVQNILSTSLLWFTFEFMMVYPLSILRALFDMPSVPLCIRQLKIKCTDFTIDRPFSGKSTTSETLITALSQLPTGIVKIKLKYDHNNDMVTCILISPTINRQHKEPVFKIIHNVTSEVVAS